MVHHSEISIGRQEPSKEATQPNPTYIVVPVLEARQHDGATYFLISYVDKLQLGNEIASENKPGSLRVKIDGQEKTVQNISAQYDEGFVSRERLPADADLGNCRFVSVVRLIEEAAESADDLTSAQGEGLE